jgi:cation:H+ antiporter
MGINYTMNEFAIPETFSMWSLAGLFVFGVAMLWVGGHLVSAVTNVIFEKCKVHEATHESARAIIFSMLGAFVPVAAIVSGSGEMALGALVGQGMIAMGLFLGVFAIAKALPIDASLRMKALPILLAAIVIFALLARGGMSLDKTDGSILIVLGLGCALFYMLVNKTAPENRISVENRTGFLVSYFKSNGNIVSLRIAYMAVVALLVLAVGAAFAVEALEKFCAHYEVSALAVGATAAALCGMIPAVAAAFGSGIFGKPFLVPGYVAGIAIFNLLLCGGLAAEISVMTVPPAFFRVGIPGLFGLAALFWLFIRTRDTIGRFEGAIMFVTWAALVWACFKGSF